MLRESLTVLEMGFVIVRKSSQDHGILVGTDISYPDINEIALYTMWLLDMRAF